MSDLGYLAIIYICVMLVSVVSIVHPIYNNEFGPNASWWVEKHQGIFVIMKGTVHPLNMGGEAEA